MGKRGPKKGTPKPPQSGRKKGTPNRISREVKDLAMELVPASFTALALMVKNKNAGQLGAIKEVFDRAFGKSPQAMIHAGVIGHVDLRNSTDEDLLHLTAVLERIAERPDARGSEGGDPEEGEGEG